MKNGLIRIIPLVIAVLVIVGPASLARSQDLEAFEKTVTEFTLDNGLTFIVVENHEAPVVSFLTYADVGSVDEVKGITGLAHVFEHMAFKGTTTIGARDLEAEYAAMEKVDEIFADLRRERHKGHQADPDRLASLEQAFEDAKKAARELAVSNELDEAIDRAGGTGLECDDKCRRNSIFLQSAVEQDRVVLRAGIQPLPGPRAPRILHRAGRGHGRTADAHREQSGRPPS